MIIAGIIILTTTVMVGIGVLTAKDGEFCGASLFGMLITIGVLVGISLIVADITEPTPTAMDVYLGKTTLEYKVVDSVKIDSIVIFKDSIYGK